MAEQKQTKEATQVIGARVKSKNWRQLKALCAVHGWLINASLDEAILLWLREKRS